jgi:hypothetical protein
MINSAPEPATHGGPCAAFLFMFTLVLAANLRRRGAHAFDPRLRTDIWSADAASHADTLLTVEGLSTSATDRPVRWWRASI